MNCPRTAKVERPKHAVVLWNLARDRTDNVTQIERAADRGDGALESCVGIHGVR